MSSYTFVYCYSTIGLVFVAIILMDNVSNINHLQCVTPLMEYEV